MKAWLKDLFRDANNDSDETVVYAVLGILTYNGLAIYDVVALAHPFNAQNFGIGFGALLTGIFAGYGIKSKMERVPPP